MFRKILCRDLVAGALKTGVQFRAALAQRRDGALDLFFPFADIGVDLLFVGEIEGIAPYTCSSVREEKFWRMVSGESPALKEYTMEPGKTRVPAG